MAILTSPVGPGDHISGPSGAAYTIVEYGDLQCPDTAVSEPELMEILQEMEEKVRLVYRHFPLADIHAHAYLAAEATEAAGAQGKFWEMREMLLENQDHLDRASVAEYAKELKLDLARFERDLDSHAFAGKIDADVQSGLRAGVEQTPTLFLNDSMLPHGMDLYEVFDTLEEGEGDDELV